eukprot:jgi/Hompol1/6116/HPOL_000709-RA
MSRLDIKPQHRDLFATLFGILDGVEESILIAAQNWREALVAYSTFVYPQLSVVDLKHVLATVTPHFPVTDSLDLLELALLDFDIPKALRVAADLDWWLATHLADLFDLAGLIEDLDITGQNDPTTVANRQNNCSVAEWYRLAYVDQLNFNPALWRTSLEYLLHCPQLGRNMLSLIIPRISLDSAIKTQKLLAFCEQHALIDSKNVLHRVLGRRALSANRYGEAIWHYLKAGESRRVSAICNKLLREYLENGNLATFNATVDSLNPALAFQHDRLAFLVRYRQFHILYAAKSYRQAGVALIDMLTSSNTPTIFWRALLLDAIPLLESPVAVFTVNETFELMRCLEDVVVRSKREKLRIPFAPKVASSLETAANGEDASLSLLRMALARNLASAMLSSSTTK